MDACSNEDEYIKSVICRFIYRRIWQNSVRLQNPDLDKSTGDFDEFVNLGYSTVIWFSDHYHL
jgi:hypothetical protein